MMRLFDTCKGGEASKTRLKIWTYRRVQLLYFATNQVEIAHGARRPARRGIRARSPFGEIAPPYPHTAAVRAARRSPGSCSPTNHCPTLIALTRPARSASRADRSPAPDTSCTNDCAPARAPSPYPSYVARGASVPPESVRARTHPCAARACRSAPRPCSALGSPPPEALGAPAPRPPRHRPTAATAPPYCAVLSHYPATGSAAVPESPRAETLSASTR